MILKLHIAKPLERLNEMLAESTSMQTLLGAESTEDAAENILYGYAEDSESNEFYGVQDEKLLPRVMTALEDSDSQKNGDSWSTAIEMSVLIQTLRLEADRNKSLSERYKSFLDRVEGVMDNLRELAADNTRLNLTSVSTMVAPRRADMKETDGLEIWWCVLLVKAGG